MASDPASALGIVTSIVRSPTASRPFSKTSICASGARAPSVSGWKVIKTKPAGRSSPVSIEASAAVLRPKAIRLSIPVEPTVNTRSGGSPICSKRRR